MRIAPAGGAERVVEVALDPASTASVVGGQTQRTGLAGGASSIDTLVRDFLAALRRSDARALESLRIGRDEYLDVVLPGSVEPGEPLQRVDRERAGPFWWEYLSERSDLNRDELVRVFGGHEVVLVGTRFAKGSKQYANHVAHRRLVLELRDADGEIHDLRTGSIAEVDGRFKFISFVRD